MLTFTEADVLAWVTPILWPFLRVLALFSALPVIAQRGVPIRLRIGLAFLIIDMIVASVLMSLGMMMLSPVLIALPFKLMLFVLADGWNLLLGSLAASFVT